MHDEISWLYWIFEGAEQGYTKAMVVKQGTPYRKEGLDYCNTSN